jgi:hypothetical protein
MMTIHTLFSLFQCHTQQSRVIVRLSAQKADDIDFQSPYDEGDCACAPAAEQYHSEAVSDKPKIDGGNGSHE